jgi:serine phosphatase RsbU (regulator of sigma subunit)
MEVICYSLPAREVGGDFYVHHAFDGSRFALAVGDVSGKGMPAALLMTVSLASFQHAISPAHAPGDLLAILDQALLPYTQTTRQNCALCYAEINGQRLRVANAGGITPLIRRVGDRVKWVDVSGLPLGIGLGAQSGYAEEALTLSQGDLLIFTSDGIVEAKNAAGEIFGFERLERAVGQGPMASAQTMLAHLQAEIAVFVGQTEAHDDMTIVILQVGAQR